MADTTNRKAGIVNLTIDGVSYQVAGECSYSPSLVKRESLVGQDQVHGYSEMPIAPHIAFKFRDSGGLKVVNINAMTSVTVVVGLANGKTVIGRNMWSVESQEINTQEAVGDVRFEGMSGSVTED